MCATCVAQGVTYVGGALAGLQVMAARARAKRGRITGEDVQAASTEQSPGAEGIGPATALGPVPDSKAGEDVEALGLSLAVGNIEGSGPAIALGALPDSKAGEDVEAGEPVADLASH